MTYPRPYRPVLTSRTPSFRRLAGLSGMNLGTHSMLMPASTYGELRAQVRDLIVLLNERPTVQITTTGPEGAEVTRSAIEVAAWLETMFLGDDPSDETELPPDDNTRFAMQLFDSIEQQAKPWYLKRVFWGSVLVGTSAVASGIHGYRRNRRSVGWAFGWGALGFVFPVITPAVALAQGYGKPKRR